MKLFTLLGIELASTRVVFDSVKNDIEFVLMIESILLNIEK